MERRRYLLSIIASAFKWLAYKFNYLYNSIIPTSVSGKQVLNKARLKTIEGNSVVENQLLRELNSTYYQSTNSSIGSFSIDNDIAKVTMIQTTTGNFAFGIRTTFNHSFTANHSMLIRVDVRCSKSATIGIDSNGTLGSIPRITTSSNVWGSIISIASGTGTSQSLWIYTQNASSMVVGDTLEIRNFKIVDLTKRYPFDTPTTLTNNRVQALINQGDIPYNTGIIKNSIISEIETKGFNIWDEEWERGSYNLNTGEKTDYVNNFRSKNNIKIVPNTSYYFKTPYPAFVLFFTKSNEYLGFHSTNAYGNTFTTPNNCDYILFTEGAGGADYNHDICINVSSSLNGTYKPHIASSKIQLPAPLETAGVGTAHNTFEVLKDSYRFTRNVFDYTFTGNETYSQNNSAYSFGVVGKGVSGNDQVGNIICDVIPTKALTGFLLDSSKNGIAIAQSGTIFISTVDYNNRANLVGKKFTYQLATPQVINIPKKHLGVARIRDLSWGLITTNVFRTIYSVPNIKVPENDDTKANIYFSNLKTSTYYSILNQTEDLQIGIGSPSGRCVVKDKSCNTVQDFLNKYGDYYIFYETNDETTDFVNETTVESGGTLNADSDVLPNVEMLLKCK